MLVFVFAIFFISCNEESVESQDAALLNTEQQVKENSQRMYYTYGIIVRNWESHNVDCSQPNGFCHEIWYITWRLLYTPQPTGTPVAVANENGQFVMTIQKSALTPEHKRELTRNGDYVIPEGQSIPSELVKSYKFSSDILIPGKYRIEESKETYKIAIDVK